MLKVGLTGGIACGKTQVVRVLAGAGLPTLDLDQVAHEVMSPGGAAYDDVVAAFGAGILEPAGTIDRKRLGAVVFADPLARARLNALVHPRVREQEGRVAAAWEADGAPAAIIDAALLVETGIHLRFDRLAVVHCPPSVQLARLMARDGSSEADARARIDAQMPIGEKTTFAHLRVDTSGSPKDTEAGALRLSEEIRALASRRPERLTGRREAMLGALVHGYAQGPGGLVPAALLAETAASRGLDLRRVGRLLAPPIGDPWYAARPPLPGPGPMALAAAAAVWCGATRGSDPPFLASAMASLGRLVGAPPEDSAAGVALGLACLDRIAGHTQASSSVSPPEWSDLARSWTGHPGPERVDGDPKTAILLAGIERGVAPSLAPGMAQLIEELIR
jgi:dephospho-CoA kinase